MAIWIAVLTTGSMLPIRFDSLSRHIHEMLFGFALAAVAGFLLTAIPNRTSLLPVSGRPLALLVGLWLGGRLVCLVSGLVPFWVAVAADLAFPVVLVAVVAREIVAGRNWRNLPMVMAVMPRVTLGHTGRSLIADRATCPCFILIGLAPLVRLAAAFTAGWNMPLLLTSAGLWMAGFGLFVLRYRPVLLKPPHAR